MPKLATQPRGGPERWQTLSQRGGQWGVEGAAPPPRGFGGCAPKFSKKGKAANSCHPATRGTQDAGEPSAYGGGPRGSRGQSPLAGGCGGCPLHKFKRGGELPKLATQPRGGPERWQTLSQRGWENRGARGRSNLLPWEDCLGGLSRLAMTSNPKRSPICPARPKRG